MDPTVLSTVIAVIALAITAYAVFQMSRAGTPITGQTVTSTLQESTVLAGELAEAGITAARAAEQLWSTGKIERDERLDYAFRYVKKWFPGVDQESILTAIEAGVQVVNAVQETVSAAGKAQSGGGEYR